MTAPAAAGASSQRPRLIQALALLLLCGLVIGLTRAAPTLHGIGTIAAVGFLLLAGTAVSELVEPLGLPHLTGYLLAGIIAGPQVVGIIDTHTTHDLSAVNALALSLIAFAGGAELRFEQLKRSAKSLAFANLLQTSLMIAGMSAVFLLARPMMPFTQGYSFKAALGIALLWAMVASVRSPSATLGVLAQLRPKGPLSEFALGFVMSSDLVVVVLLATMLPLSRALIDPTSQLSLDSFVELGHHLLGGVSIGTTLGLVLALYLRLIGRQLQVVFVALGFVLTEVLRYLHFDPMLSFMVAGFVVQNLSSQGTKFLHGVEKLGALVYVLFFASAGAHLDIRLLKELWPVALVLCGSRALLTWGLARLHTRIAKDPPVLQRFAWAPMISQAGLTLGVAAVIARTYPTFGSEFAALTLAAVALNELVGPVIFKLSLDRAGEVGVER